MSRQMTIVTQIWISDLDQHPAKLLECSWRFAIEESHIKEDPLSHSSGTNAFNIYSFLFLTVRSEAFIGSIELVFFYLYSLASEGQ